MKASFAVIAFGLIMASAPATSASSAAHRPTADGKSDGSRKSRQPDMKYCLDYEATTGSRISNRACKTKAQWAAEGVNIDKL